MNEYAPGTDPFSVSGTTSETTKDDLHKGGSGPSVSKEGMFHVVIQSVEFNTTTDKTPNVKMVMDCLNGTELSESGKRVYHRIYFKPADTPEKEQRRFERLLTFLFEFGVISEAEAFGKESVTISKGHFERLEGCQAIVKISHEKASPYKDDQGVEKIGTDKWKIAWDNEVWNLAHEHVKDVPKDWEMAQHAAVRSPSSAADSAAALADDLDGI